MVISPIQYIGGVPSSWLGREGLCPKVSWIVQTIDVFRRNKTSMAKFAKMRMIH